MYAGNLRSQSVFLLSNICQQKLMNMNNIVKLTRVVHSVYIYIYISLRVGLYCTFLTV